MHCHSEERRVASVKLSICTATASATFTDTLLPSIVKAWLVGTEQGILWRRLAETAFN